MAVTVPGATVPAATVRRGRRRLGERLIEAFLVLAAIVSIATTIGIVVSLLFPTVEFFREISIVEFVTSERFLIPFLIGFAVTFLIGLATNR